MQFSQLPPYLPAHDPVWSIIYNLPYSVIIFRFPRHPSPIATLHVHTPLKSTHTLFFLFDPLSRFISLTGRAVSFLVSVVRQFFMLFYCFGDVCTSWFVLQIKPTCTGNNHLPDKDSLVEVQSSKQVHWYRSFITWADTEDEAETFHKLEKRGWCLQYLSSEYLLICPLMHYLTDVWKNLF